jgi:hypothetical protein
MFRNSFRPRAFIGLVLAIALSSSVFADTIRLKDGSLIKGTIVSFADGRFVIVVGEGSRRRELSLAVDEIASIQFDSHNGTSAANVSRPTSNDSSNVPVSTRIPPKVVVTDNTNGNTETKKTGSSTKSNGNSAYNPPKTDPPSGKTTDNTANRTNSDPGTSRGKPISISVKVLADDTANGWTNSGWIVKRGQRIRITGTGTVSLGHGQMSTPSGLPDLEDPQKLLRSVPTGALIAVIGDDNNDFIYIGEEREFTAGRDGALYLGVNEGNLKDNKGAYDVKVEIIPDK